MVRIHAKRRVRRVAICRPRTVPTLCLLGNRILLRALRSGGLSWLRYHIRWSSARSGSASRVNVSVWCRSVQAVVGDVRGSGRKVPRRGSGSFTNPKRQTSNIPSCSSLSNVLERDILRASFAFLALHPSFLLHPVGARCHRLFFTDPHQLLLSAQQFSSWVFPSQPASLSFSPLIPSSSSSN